MKWEEMAVVGRIARPHGIRGQVIVNVETDFPEKRFQAGVELFGKKGASIERLMLTTVRFQNGRPIIGVAGIDSVDAARQWVGVELKVPTERLSRLPPGTFYRHDLVGCAVETNAGQRLGTVTEVEGPLDASRLVVASGSDEILVPFAADICTAIDASSKRIVITPPDGLLGLNCEPIGAEQQTGRRRRPSGRS
ncbi:MAG: 16S rRNA processing protein RimM [Blastocatellia bacterium]|nr:MAG: 16S rRNA processing protein RimM [Blastocatellia bacterium]